MKAQPDAADLDQLLAERGDQLIRAAIALAGNRADGEDLLQAGLERLLRSRHLIESDLEGYLRRILYNLAADGWRRRATGERKLRLIAGRGAYAADGTAGPDRADATAAVDLRDALVRWRRSAGARWHMEPLSAWCMPARSAPAAEPSSQHRPLSGTGGPVSN